jgi:hypothetical protein
MELTKKQLGDISKKIEKRSKDLLLILYLGMVSGSLLTLTLLSIVKNIKEVL